MQSQILNLARANTVAGYNNATSVVFHPITSIQKAWGTVAAKADTQAIDRFGRFPVQKTAIAGAFTGAGFVLANVTNIGTKTVFFSGVTVSGALFGVTALAIGITVGVVGLRLLKPAAGNAIGFVVGHLRDIGAAIGGDFQAAYNKVRGNRAADLGNPPPAPVTQEPGGEQEPGVLTEVARQGEEAVHGAAQKVADKTDSENAAGPAGSSLSTSVTENAA